MVYHTYMKDVYRRSWEEEEEEKERETGSRKWPPETESECRDGVFVRYSRSSKIWFYANDHTTLNTPLLVRSAKLSNVGSSQYLDGWPPGNTRCCWLLDFQLETTPTCQKFQPKNLKKHFFYTSNKKTKQTHSTHTKRHIATSQTFTNSYKQTKNNTTKTTPFKHTTPNNN